MKYYILADDLASAVIGPFDNSDMAEAHIEFCRQRGDSAEMEVASETFAYKWAIEHNALQMTAEEDHMFKYAGGNNSLPIALIDPVAAQAELDALSTNAKRYIADTLGNPLYAARLTLELLILRIADIHRFTTECNEDAASCDCSFHENLKAAETTHERQTE